MEAWWTRTSPLFPRFAAMFREKLEDISGRNPLLLRGVEKAARDFKKRLKNRVGNTESEETDDNGESSKEDDNRGNEEDKRDEQPEGQAEENGAIWRQIYETDEWMDAQSRIDSYAGNYISGKADAERKWYQVEAFMSSSASATNPQPLLGFLTRWRIVWSMSTYHDRNVPSWITAISTQRGKTLVITRLVSYARPWRLFFAGTQAESPS